MKLGLENIRTLLDALGNPQNNYKKVQVAGTNGKGSVCAFLDSICLQAGIRTGLYTSPHLVSITERVKIDGVDISDEDFGRLATRVKETAEMLVADERLERVPTFFEQVTAIALLAFAEAKVELAILETGLGGRFDAVTAANAEIVAITRIDLDHQEYLGDTIEKIAAEKAAIIRKSTLDVVLGEQNAAVLRILRDRCREMQIKPSNEIFEPWSLVRSGPDTIRANFTLHKIDNIRLGLKGRHQVENALTAIRTAQCLEYSNGFAIDEDAIAEGLENARHPGRLEPIGNFLLDGAHNPGGAAALAAYIDEFVDWPITMIFGAMRDKNVAEIAEILWPRAERIVLTLSSNSRALSAEEIAAFASSRVDPAKIIKAQTVAEAVQKAKEFTSTDGVILVTGSLYLVGEVKKLLNNRT